MEKLKKKKNGWKDFVRKKEKEKEKGEKRRGEGEKRRGAPAHKLH